MTTQRFEELAAQIVQMFPGETKDTYFVPGIFKNRQKIATKGVLYASYNHKRAKYIKLGLVERRIKDDGKK